MKKLISAVLLSLIPFLATPTFANFDKSSKLLGDEIVAAVTEQININTADATTLIKLKGVGFKKAEAIVLWREENGQFKNIEQLMDVKGIGPAIFELNRDRLTI